MGLPSSGTGLNLASALFLFFFRPDHMPRDSPGFRHLIKLYKWEKWYTLHVYTANGLGHSTLHAVRWEWDKLCTSTLLTVHDVCILHVQAVGVGERDTLHVHIAGVEGGYTLHGHSPHMATILYYTCPQRKRWRRIHTHILHFVTLLLVEGDKTYTSVLMVLERVASDGKRHTLYGHAAGSGM